MYSQVEKEQVLNVRETGIRTVVNVRDWARRYKLILNARLNCPS